MKTKENKTQKTIKTVKEMIENKHLLALTEGAGFIKWLKSKFKDTNVKIDVDAEYELFEEETPHFKRGVNNFDNMEPQKF